MIYFVSTCLLSNIRTSCYLLHNETLKCHKTEPLNTSPRPRPFHQYSVKMKIKLFIFISQTFKSETHAQNIQTLNCRMYSRPNTYSSEFSDVATFYTVHIKLNSSFSKECLKLNHTFFFIFHSFYEICCCHIFCTFASRNKLHRTVT